MSKADDPAYGYAPRFFGIEEASRYLGISASTFRALGICPINIGRRTLWDRQSLDLYADRLTGKPVDDDDAERAAQEQERAFFARRNGG